MLQEFMNKILLAVIALDTFALGILVLFLINFRINIKRRVREREFSLKVMAALQKTETITEAAERIGIPAAEVTHYCQTHNIETPEKRKERQEAVKKRNIEENRRIMEEEAAWRAEQDRVAAERQREKEIETKQRRERLKKFGIV